MRIFMKIYGTTMILLAAGVIFFLGVGFHIDWDFTKAFYLSIPIALGLFVGFWIIYDED